MENPENEENKSTVINNDQELIKEIFEKRNKQPRKSWFGQDCEKKQIEKRLSQMNIGSEEKIEDLQEKIKEMVKNIEPSTKIEEEK